MPNTIETKRKALYDQLVNDNYDMPDYDSFSQSLNDEATRKSLYEDLTNEGYDIGDYDTFSGKIFATQPVEQPKVEENSSDERVKMTYSTPNFNPTSFAATKPQERVATTPKEKPEFGLNSGIPSIADTTKAMIEGRIKSATYTQQTPQEPEAITAFGEGVKQGTEQLAAGAQYGIGEAAASVLGTSRDDIEALAEIERLQAEGKDVAEETKNVTDLSTVSPIIKKGLELMGAGKAIGDAEKITQRNRTIQKALEENGGDVEKAKVWLESRAGKRTWADEMMADATDKMAQAKPTKGWGWVGSMIPQMAGTGVGLAASVVFKSPLPAQILGGANMAGLTLSTAGQAMAEARQAGASNSQVWGAGVVNGAIELLTEKIPFDRYTSKIVNAAKRQASKTLADAASEVGSPANRELQDLLTRANKELNGRLFSGKNVREYLGDVVAEGLSEAAAEGLQTIVPIMYESPENYPTLLEIIGNAVEGAKGGLFMGMFLGGASKSAEHRMNRARRKQQGFVDVAEVIDAEGKDYVVEVVRDENDQEVFYWDGKKIPILDMEVKQRHAYNFDDFERAQIELEQDEAYENGRTLETPQEMNDTGNMLDIQESNMRRLFSLNEDESIDEYLGDNPLRKALDMRETDEEGAQIVIDYLNAKATYDGIIGAAQDRIEQEAMSAGAIIDSRKSSDDGLVYPAKMKLDDREVYVVSGSVALLDDGSIDRQNSAESIIVVDANTGKREFASVKDLLSVDAALDPEAEKATVRANIADSIATEVDNKLNGILPFNIGDTYTVMGDDGAQHTAQVVAIDDENTVQVLMDNETKPTTANKGIIQQMADAYNRSRAELFEQGKQEQRAAEKIQQEAQQMAESTTQAEQAVQPTIETEPEQAPRVVPMQKDGKTPDYNAMDAEMFVEEYVSRFGEDSAIKIARNNIKSARTEIAKIDKKIDEVSDPNKMQALADQKAVEEAKLARYSDIIGRLGAMESETETESDEKARLRNESGNRITTLFPDGMPNVESFILADIATGNRIRWSDKVTNGVVTSRGLGAELGLSDSKQERTRRLPLIGKDAMTPEEYAESLRERLDAVGIRYDESSLRDAVLGVYQSVDSRKGAWDALENMSKKMQEPQTDMDWEDIQQQMAYNKAQNDDAPALPDMPDLETIEEEVPISEGEYREEAYNRQTTAKQPAEVVETSQSVESNGTQTPSSLIDVSTPKSSESKDTTTEPNAQEAEQKNVVEEYGYNGRSLTTDEAKAVINAMQQNAIVVELLELTPENWIAQFGEDGIIDTPIGNVKMGENQYFKLAQKGREGKLGMIKPTLQYPDIIVEEKSSAKNGQTAERNSSYVFVKAFTNTDGSRNYLFTSVTIRKDGKEVVISNQEKETPRIERLLKEGKLAYISEATLPSESTNSTQGNQSTILGGAILSESKDTTSKPQKQEVDEKISQEEQKVNVNPTDGQKEAGNYKKGHVVVDGFNITIEQPKGSVRSGVDADGKEWSVTMNNTYGYIRGTEGVDGDHIDVFLSDNLDNWGGEVFVVDQINTDGSFDEHKVMYGFNSIEEAQQAYLSNYSEGWQGLGAITGISKDEFKKWIASSHRKTKPFAEYKSVKATEGQSAESVEATDDEQILFRRGEKSVQEEVTETIFATAKEKFGTTYDMREAGYILPDGSMLDFSGKHEIRGADTSFLNGQRSVDHRAIQEIAYDFDENKTGVETDMGDFLDRGAIRIDYNTGAINLNVAPTKAQKDRLKRLIERNDGDVYIDFGKGWDTEHYVEYESARASRVLGDIDRYFNEGIKPSGNIRFRSAESAEPAPVFYSNAEYAVKAVKQDKATPEQWLKMIEKNGGLKAGEDKWLGLSDWLKSSDKKTLTKQEVLDLIKENQIQIEEVEYAENPQGFEELKKEYDGWLRDGGYDYAWDKLIERYGYDSTVAFDDVGGELVVQYGNTASKLLGGEVSTINNTRLGYTTNGLENKREFALTVPTIESWNESDEIHFGDAGNGRAIAWVRFGETTDADGNRVLVIDEVQSKRHQEGREKGYNNPRVLEIFTRLANIESNLYSPQGLSMEMQSEREALKAELEYIFENDNPVMKSIAEQLDEKKSKRTALLRERLEREDDERVEILKLQAKQDEVRNNRDYDYYESEIDKIKERIDQRNEELDLLASDIIDLNLEYSRYYNTEIRNARIGVSPAPFEKNWAELAMKRMLRYAAENGFDKVAWTTGEQQADRYDLSKSVDVINAEHNEDGSYNINVATVDDSHFIQENNIPESRLTELVGKEMALSIVKATQESEDGKAEIEGNNLRIGGSGMKAFYDQMIPSFMNKYGKKWGVKVGEVTMPSLEENNTMHSIDVTDAMRESVMQGQPMFRTSDRVQATLNSWYDDIAERHNIEGNIEIAPSREEFEQALLANGVSQERLSEYDKAAYIRSKNMYLINGEGINDNIEAERAIFHEVWHKLTREIITLPELEWLAKSIGSGRLNALNNAVWDGKFNTDEAIVDELLSFSIEPYIEAEVDVDGVPMSAFEAYLGNHITLNKATELAKSKMSEDASRFSDVFDKIFFETKRTLITYKNQYYGKEQDKVSRRGEQKGTQPSTKQVLENRRLQANRNRTGGGRTAATGAEQRQRAIVAEATNLASSLGVKLNVIEDVNEITDSNARRQRAKRGAKAWYDVNTDQVYFVAPNATSIADAQESVLHEVVAHKGLRDVVGRENFKKFLDKVYQSAAPEIRTQIIRLAAQNGWDIREATEEYLASLAEQGFDSRENRTFWQKVRDLFMDMLREAKIAIGYNITDNDMRYMLWRTYQMQKSQGAMAFAEDVLMQQKMGVGNFRTRPMTEEEQIIADAKANGTYLKAPNGNDTNLTPKQWAQVRTNAFKKWFGDWEKAARIEKLRKSKDAEITGNEIEASEDLKQYKKNAQMYGRTLQGEYTNTDTGAVISLQRGRHNGGINEVLQHNYKDVAHLQSVAAIPQIIENGIYIESQPNKDTDTNPDVKEYQMFVCGLKIGGEDYTVLAKVAVDSKGNRYYDHNLVSIEKGKLIDIANNEQSAVSSGFGTTPDTKSTTNSQRKYKELISLLQTNSSKIVDANGEPKVVWHQTNATEYVNVETGEKWDDLDWRAKMDWDERDDWDEYWEEQDFYTFSRVNARTTNEFDGFFFAPEYDGYHEYGKRAIPAFLNIRKPASREDYNIDSSRNNAGRDERLRLQSEGYDGVIREYDGVVDEYIAFEPNQIKSATDNVGTFDSNNDDIRFRSAEITEQEQVNARFNEELNELTEDNARERILNVGMPSPILRASGVENKPIRLYGAKLLSKVRKHGYKLSDLQNLPSALGNPIAVFKGSSDGSFAILTELAIGNNNVLATLSIGKGGHDVDFNIISSVYDKRSENVLRWINDGKLLYVNKEKALNYFSVSAPVAEAQNNQGLSSVTKIVENFENPTIYSTKNEPNNNIRFRSDKPEPPAQGVAREMYDRAVRKRIEGKNNVGRFENLWHHIVESYQDSMLAVNDLYKAILAETGKKLHSFEDVYKAENRLSSMNKAQIEAWERDFMKPLQNVIMTLIGNGTTYNDIIEYILAKSGIERNMVLAERDAEEATNRWEEKRLKGAERAFRYEEKRINGTYGGNLAALRKSLDTGVISQQEYDTKAAELEVQRNKSLDKVLKKYERLKKKIKADRSEMYLKAWDKNIDKDYSGLTELTEEKQNFNIAAQGIVDAFEGEHNTTPLWDAINAATKESLRKSYDSGMMNKETFDKVSNMFKYYVPLRGWDNNVAADHYEYMLDKGMKILPALKAAKGRTSRADDPIATIGSMGESSIIQGNRNVMKQKLLNFAQNNPTSLLTVGEQWYVKMPDGTWVEHNPVIPENATGDEVDAIIKQHEADMKALGEDATKSRNKLNLGMHATSWEGQEHVINVKRNGKVYQIFVNGNPIAAQAINGFTNPNAKESWLSKAASAIKNFMARVFTSQNPAFVVTNLSRDVIWAGTSVAIKENPEYAKQYAKNIAKAFGVATLPRMVHKWKNGTLDMNNITERYFHEFITNGGETGFTQLNTVDDYKRNMRRFIKEAQGGAATTAKKAWRGFWEGVEFLNRSAEDTTRFMVYMTSRQMGRSISESVSNAKDVTVNFNKKGRGEYGASMMNYLYIFFNATIQSLANFGKLIKEHPVKAMAAISTYTTAGFLLPLAVNALQAMLNDDDEEKDSYWDLPEWARRNNIVLGAGGVYVTIPLPHELRPFYGLGEIAYSVLSGKESVEDGLKKASEGFAALLPFDFTGNGSNAVINFTPTIAQPLVQVHYNTDYFGTPIYRKTAFNEKDPEWTKAYKSTNAMAVDAAEFINYITGGDIVKKGAIDINPAVVEHIVEAYLGGLGKTLNRTAKSLSMIWDEDMREVRNVPILNSFLQVSDERSTGSQLSREYFNALDEFENTEHLLQGYKKQKNMGAMEYAEKLDALMRSPIYKRYEIIKGRKKAISELNKQLQMADPTDQEDIETRIMNLKVDMLEALNAVDEKPIDVDSSNK